MTTTNDSLEALGSLDTSANPASLDGILRPRTVAVIGASRKRGTIGAEVFANLLRHDFAGAAYPVNPNAHVVQSVRTYPTVEDVPDEVDLAVVVVPQPAVLEVVEACGRKGVRGLIVVSAGFREVGAAGLEAERKVVEVVRHYGMRLIGPNCLGVLNTAPDIRMNATFAPTYPPVGNVGFVSQSGALGVAILDHARELGIGVSLFCSVGNKADVSPNDLLEYFEADPATGVILLYLESFGNPRKFARIARRVSRKKPIVVVKSGRSAAGSRAAASHTGALAGADVAADALFHQAGVIRVDTVSDLFAMAMLLSVQPIPAGRRIGILTNAGGPGILAADACESHGLKVSAFSEPTQARLREFLPAEASVRNPVDMIASAGADDFRRAAAILLDAPEVDALLAIFVPPITGDTAAVSRAIVDAASRTDKPVACSLMGTHGVVEGEAELRHGGVPSYAYPTGAAIALARAAAYGEWLRRPPGKDVRPAGIDRPRAAALLDAASTGEGSSEPRWLPMESTVELLATHGIRHAALRFVPPDPVRAAAVAAEVGFPVALKIASRGIVHKSDVGGVVLDLADAAAVEENAGRILSTLRHRGEVDKLDGFIVEEMVSGGVEVIIGMCQDPTFGPVIMFGMGGVQVELLCDVSFRITPLTDADAHEMVRAIKGWPLLDGYRGAAPADVDALEEILLRVAHMVDAFPEILEMDLNPIKVLPRGGGAVVVDARVRLHATP